MEVERMSDQQLSVVNRIYEAFGTGDVPTILGYMAADVEWEYGWASTVIPWLQPGRGPAHVGEFFQTLAEQLEFSRFEVNHVLVGDAVVVALVTLEALVRSTGRTIVETDEVHIWHFDGSGRVSRFRHAADTLQQAQALGYELREPAPAL
ncbi:MAG: nuclear transport factor 2 family protein [Dehalococcoidia bacterium]